MSDVVSTALGGAAGWSIGQRFNRRHARRLAAKGRIECSLRVASGVVDGLGGRWSHGVATVAEGTLTFIAYLPPGIRVRNPFRRRVDLEVITVSPVGARVRASVWGPGPGTVSVTLHCGDATIQAAVHHASADWFVDALAGAGRFLAEGVEIGKAGSSDQ